MEFDFSYNLKPFLRQWTDFVYYFTRQYEYMLNQHKVALLIKNELELQERRENNNNKIAYSYLKIG